MNVARVRTASRTLRLQNGDAVKLIMAATTPDLRLNNRRARLYPTTIHRTQTSTARQTPLVLPAHPSPLPITGPVPSLPDVAPPPHFPLPDRANVAPPQHPPTPRQPRPNQILPHPAP